MSSFGKKASPLPAADARAFHTEAQNPGGVLGLQVGDIADVCRPPASKVVFGWKWPAVDADISHISHGIMPLHLKAMQQSDKARTRRAFVYPVVLVAASPRRRGPRNLVRQFCVQFRGQVVISDWVRNAQSGWNIARDASFRWQVCAAVLQIAARGLRSDELYHSAYWGWSSSVRVLFCCAGGVLRCCRQRLRARRADLTISR